MTIRSRFGWDDWKYNVNVTVNRHEPMKGQCKVVQKQGRKRTMAGLKMQRRGRSRTRGALAVRPWAQRRAEHSKGSTMSGGWRAAGQGSKAKHGVSGMKSTAAAVFSGLPYAVAANRQKDWSRCTGPAGNFGADGSWHAARKRGKGNSYRGFG